LEIHLEAFFHFRNASFIAPVLFLLLPIATYGFRLWFFAGASTKAQVSLLAAMQRKAALWILGAFCTSPTGRIEALAGLIPIHLHLKKLVK